MSNRASTASIPRRREPAAVRRAQILAAAFECVAERGYHGTTMDDLVRTTGLSKGSLYWHFRSKDDVFLALFESFEDEFFAAWLDDDPAGAILPHLRAAGDAVFARFGSESKLLFAWAEFLTHPGVRERFATIYTRSRSRLGDLLDLAAERGEIRPLPGVALAAGLIAAIEGLLLQTMMDPGFEAEAHWPVVFEALTEGVKC